MLLLGHSTSSVSGIKTKSRYLDIPEYYDADSWQEVSKTTKGGPDIDDFVTHYAKQADNQHYINSQQREAAEEAAEEQAASAEESDVMEDKIKRAAAHLKSVSPLMAETMNDNGDKKKAHAQSEEGAQSDPIHGSLGPPKCDEDDFATPEQKLMAKMKNFKPPTYRDDPDIWDATQNSIKWAETRMQTKLRDPNLHKESYWYYDLTKKRNDGLQAGERVSKGPKYDDREELDPDVAGTLKSARVAEDFHGIRHPNRFTGEFDEEGNHLVTGDSSGKGAFTPGQKIQYDKDGMPISRGGKKYNKYSDMPSDPDDPTGLSGYCGAPLNPDDPEYQDDYSKSPRTPYSKEGKYPGGKHPKDWWNHLIKDRKASAGYPRDGMDSNDILNVKDTKGKMKLKYGDDWDTFSEQEKAKLEKEQVDKEEVDKGVRLNKQKLKPKDRDMVKDLDTLQSGTSLVNYTRRDNPNPGPKTLQEKAQDRAEGKVEPVKPLGEGETPSAKDANAAAEEEEAAAEGAPPAGDGEKTGSKAETTTPPAAEGEPEIKAPPAMEGGAPAPMEGGAPAPMEAPIPEKKEAEATAEAIAEGDMTADGEMTPKGEAKDAGEGEGGEEEHNEEEGHEEGAEGEAPAAEGEAPAAEGEGGEKVKEPADPLKKPKEAKGEEGPEPPEGKAAKEIEEAKELTNEIHKDDKKPDPLRDNLDSATRTGIAPEHNDPEKEDVRPAKGGGGHKHGPPKGGHKHGPPGGNGHGGHGPPGGHKHGPPGGGGGHAQHGPKGGGNGHKHGPAGGGHKHGPPGGGHKHGPPGGGHKHGPPGGGHKHGPPGAHSQLDAPISAAFGMSSTFSNPEQQEAEKEARDEAFEAKEMKEREATQQSLTSHFAPVTISIGGAEVNIDEISKQKVQNRFDEDFLEEDVQICSDLKTAPSSQTMLQMENKNQISNQRKLEKLMRCNELC